MLAPSNRDMKAMCDYAIEAADWSTELPHLDFAVSERERERNGEGKERGMERGRREERRGERERNGEGKERGTEGIKCVM